MDPIDYQTYQPNLDHDIPVAYAVFSPILDETGTHIVDMRYVFANHKYCLLTDRKKEDLLGHSLCENFDEINLRWFEFCYGACFEGKTSRSRMYSPEAKHWLEFEVSPISVPGYCAFTFLDVDEETAQKVNLLRDNKTDTVIIHLLSALVNPNQYTLAIQNVLGELSEEIHPDRIYILETDGKTISNTFEWCKPGIESEIKRLQKLPCDQYMKTWNSYLKGNTSVIIENVEDIKDDDPLVYQLLKSQDIQRVINSPIYDNGKIIGFVGVDNYERNDGLNMQRILETVAYFLSAKMVKERLLKKLDFLSHFDALTGVYNRNALMTTIARLEETDKPVGIVYVDDNGLKQLNDTYGHFYGDLHIKKTAQTLVDCFGAHHVYRAGGDEFVVLVPGMDEIQFQSLMTAYRDMMQNAASPSVAVGHQWIPSAKQLEKAIHQADKQMYEDKALYYKNHAASR